MGANAGLNRRVAVSRGRGMFVMRSSRNAGARRDAQTRTGRGPNGTLTVLQRRELLANRTAAGNATSGRKRRL